MTYEQAQDDVRRIMRTPIEQCDEYDELVLSTVIEADFITPGFINKVDFGCTHPDVVNKHAAIVTRLYKH